MTKIAFGLTRSLKGGLGGSGGVAFQRCISGVVPVSA